MNFLFTFLKCVTKENTSKASRPSRLVLFRLMSVCIYKDVTVLATSNLYNVLT